MTEPTTFSFTAELEQQNAALRRRLADQAMAGELLLGVLAARTEMAAVAGLIDLTEQLCSPAVSAYLPAQPGAAPILHPSSPELLAAVTALVEQLPADRAWVATDDGFAVRVDAGGQQLGTLVVCSVRFPEYVSDYLNLMLTTAGVVGMAILLGRERQPQVAGAEPADMLPSPRAAAVAEVQPPATSTPEQSEPTARHGDHGTLTARLRHLGDTLDSIPAAVVVVLPVRDTHGEVVRFECVHVNPAALAWFGLPHCDGHRTPAETLTVLDETGLVPMLRQVAQSGEPQWLDHAPNATSGSGRLWVGSAGECLVVLGQPRNSPPPVNAAAGQALGLSMQTRAQVAAQMAAQLGTGTADPTLMLLDIDDFRSVNDAMGHEFGDRYLVGVADAIADLLVAGDQVSRVGGDEFAISVRSGTDPAELAERIRDRLAAGIRVASQVVTAAASIGVATGSATVSAHSLVAQADTAMAQAKQGGGNQWFMARSASNRDSHVIKLEHELREALIADQLLLRYQPVFDLVSGRLAATEALIRWQHPQRGMVMPAEFIPVAERRHLIVPVGEWVLRRACSQAAAWRRELGEAAPTMAVNVSTLELGGHGLPRRLGPLLSDFGLPGSALYLEITETQLISATDQVSAELAAVRALGVGVAIDDFGTGHAGFDYLRTIPANILKVDKSFIDGLCRDATDTAIAASIITLGRNLGMTVVAEGVEEEDQLALLTDLGCHQGQGWLWRPALQASDAAALVGVPESHARA